MGSKNLSLWDNKKKTTEVSGNPQKPKRNYIAADGHTKNF